MNPAIHDMRYQVSTGNVAVVKATLTKHVRPREPAVGYGIRLNVVEVVESHLLQGVGLLGELTLLRYWLRQGQRVTVVLQVLCSDIAR